MKSILLFVVSMIISFASVYSQQAQKVTKEQVVKSQPLSEPSKPAKDMSAYQTNPKQLQPIVIKQAELRAMPPEQQEKLKKAAIQYPHSVKIIED